MKYLKKGNEAPFDGFLLNSKEYIEYRNIKNRMRLASELKNEYFMRLKND